MTKAEKRKFLRELTSNVLKDVLAKVDQMPDEWDGIELRRYLADRFEAASIKLPGSKFGGERKAMRSRYRAYRNEVLVRNL